MQKDTFSKRYATVLYFVIITGVFLGCVLYYFDCETGLLQITGWNLEDYSIEAMGNIPAGEFTKAVLRRRLIQLVIFLLGMTITSFGVMSVLYGSLFGIFYGMFSCNLILQYGPKGILFDLFCFLPHYLFYILCLLFISKGSTLPDDWRGKSGNVNVIQYFFKFFVIFFLFFCAILFEIKFQKKFLGFFYQYLV